MYFSFLNKLCLPSNFSLGWDLRGSAVLRKRSHPSQYVVSTVQSWESLKERRMQGSGRGDVRGYESSEVCTELYQQLLTLTEEESSVLGKGKALETQWLLVTDIDISHLTESLNSCSLNEPGEIFSTSVSRTSYSPLWFTAKDSPRPWTLGL